ncbi:hypothetical protein D3C86_1129440 [compost metagenome]
MAPAHVGLAGFELVGLGLALAHLMLVQARLQHRHGLGTVAVLRTVVLALHDDAGGDVGNPHRRIGLVDVLPARARGAVGIHAQVGRVDFHLERIVHLGVHEHRRERRVAAARRIERRLAHQAVHAGLGAQVAERVVALDLDRCALDAGHVALGFLEHLGLEALALAVLQVLAQQHRCPVARFRAAGAGLDVDEGVRLVHLAREHAAEFHAGHDVLEALDVGLDGLERFIVAFLARELEQLVGAGQVVRQLPEDLYHGLERFLFLAQVLGPLGVVPDLRVFQLAVDFVQASYFDIVVKDTPVDLPSGNGDRRWHRRWR